MCSEGTICVLCWFICLLLKSTPDIRKLIFFSLVPLLSATSDPPSLKICDCVVLIKGLLFFHLRHSTIISLFRSEISLGGILKIHSHVSRVEGKV